MAINDSSNQRTPSTPDELAVVLREASEQDQIVTPWGAGTRQHIGNPPDRAALTLSTTALDRVLEHVPADMTVSVEAGIALGKLQAILSQHHQWLPWDPPSSATATLGGLLATAASGPLRLGYGTPRDWVLGMRVALGDGRLVKSGGKVVKNVAGYDTHKLHIGALGTLGVIAEITLKVFPRPDQIRTLLFACADRACALQLMERVRVSPLAPVSLLSINSQAATEVLPGADWIADPREVVALRFAGVPAAVERQVQMVLTAVAEMKATALPLSAEQEDDIWRRLADFPVPRGKDVILRAAAHPSSLNEVLDALSHYAPDAARSTPVIGYSAVGLAYVRWSFPPDTDVEQWPRALATLRATLTPLGGYVVVEDAPPELRTMLDVWGPPPATLSLMQALRRQWDPHHILNRGRYLLY